MNWYKLHKKSQMTEETPKVEKSEGEYEDVRNAFPGDNETQREMIDEMQQEEIAEEQKDEFEKGLADEIQGESPEYQELSQENIDSNNNIMSEIVQNMNTGEEMSIDYVTKSGYPITRTVRPIQMYMANTGNNILLTLTREWKDYRAYIIDNIQ
jgi:hypothetical protein